jgi:CHAD domain-containing protein
MNVKKLEDIPHGEDAAKVAAAVVVAGAAAAAGKVAHDRLGSSSNGHKPHRFRLEPGEKLSDGIRGVLEGQVQRAASHLQGRDGETPDKAVHEARKSFKRSRATLRLARDELGAEAFSRENRRYRDLGRDLSGARDADVLLAALDDIATRSGREGAFAGLRERLVAERDARRGELLHDDSARSAALDRLKDAEDAIGGLPLDDDLGALMAGWRRTYRDGRRAYRAAGKEHTTETLHEWRKRVKDLWHQSQVFQPLWPARLKAMAGQASKLSDALGEDHDLAVLSEKVRENDDALTPEERRLLSREIKRRRRKLQKKADELGAKLYAERPRKLAGRLEKRARKALAAG